MRAGAFAPILGASIGALVPPWVLPSANVDLDFADAQYYPDLVSTLAISRASVGYATNADGTLTSFASGALRIGVGTGLLVEESRTNLVLQSGTFTGSGWTLNNIPAPATDGTLAPDTSQLAMKITTNSGLNIHDTYISVGTPTWANPLSLTIYAKKGNWNYFALNIEDSSGWWITAVFDLNLGAVGQTAGGGTGGTISRTSITSLANGWYRCELTGTISGGTSTGYAAFAFAGAATGNTFDAFGQVQNFTAVGTEYFYAWGMQLEAASFPTSYIPTTTASVTRAADVVTTAGSFATIGGGGAMSLFFQGSGGNSPVPGGYNIILDGSNDVAYLYWNSTNYTVLSNDQLSTTQSITAPNTLHGNTKAMFAGDRSGSSITSFGQSVVTGAGTYTIANSNPVSVGCGGGLTTQQYDGYINRVAGWNTRQLDTTLQYLTWVMTGGGYLASVDMDFADGLYYPAAVTSLLSISNASGGYVTNAAGTLTSIAANTLRIGTGSGLLVEESRTNLLLQGTNLNGFWAVAGSGSVTFTANVTAAPDGTTTAASIVENTATTAHGYIQSIAKATSSLAYTFSLYVKRPSFGSARNIAIQGNDASGNDGAYVSVDLGTGANLGSGNFGTGWTFTSYSAAQLANGWWRISVSFTSDASSSMYCGIYLNQGASTTYTGDGTSGLYIWGAQLEQATFPTSFIPTTTTAVTRAADAVTFGAIPEPLLEAATGSVLAITGALPDVSINRSVVMMTNRELVDITAASTFRMYNGTNTLTATLGSGAYNSGGSDKSAAAWDGTGRSAVGNNGTVATDANSVGTVSGTYSFGSTGGSSNFLNGYISRTTIWSNRLANTVLKVIST